MKSYLDVLSAGGKEDRRSGITEDWNYIAENWEDLISPYEDTRDVLRQEMIDGVVGSEACSRLEDSKSSPDHVGLPRRERVLSFNQPGQLDEAVNSTLEDAACGMDLSNTSKGLCIAHLNVRSLLPKISEIRLLCSELKLSVLGCSETWLDGSILDSEIEIVNYNLIRRDRRCMCMC